MSDKHFSNVVSLMHYNGADASTTFTDETGKTWTRTGQVQIDTAQSKFGGASCFFDGNIDYLTTPDSSDFDLGSSDFTIEQWVMLDTLKTTAGNYSALISRDDVAGTRGWILFSSGDLGGKFRFSARVGGTSYFCDTTTTPSVSTWYHVATTRTGGNLRMFLNGTLEATTAISGTINNATGLTVQGALRSGAGYLSTSYTRGWFDELRVTKGFARYTSSFTLQPGPWAGYKALGVYGNFQQPVILVAA